MHWHAYLTQMGMSGGIFNGFRKGARYPPTSLPEGPAMRLTSPVFNDSKWVSLMTS